MAHYHRIHHSDIFIALLEDVLQSLSRNASENSDDSISFGPALKSAVQRAGLAPLSEEAQTVHGEIFSLVFSGNASHYRIVKANGEGSCSDFLSLVSETDYFEILCEAGLGWIYYFQELLPLLPLSMVQKVVESLDHYVTAAPKETTELVHVQLCLCVLTSTFNILLDLFVTCASEGLKGGSYDKEEAIEQEIHLETESKALQELEKLSHSFHSCLSHLLILLDHTPVFESVQDDGDCFIKVCEALLLCCVFVGSGWTACETADLLQQCLSEIATSGPQTSDKGRKEKSNQLYQKCGREQEEFEMTEIQLPSLYQGKIDGTIVETPKGEINNIFTKALSMVRANVSPKHICDIIRFFSRGSLEDNPSFYKPVIEIILSTNVSVFHHALKGPELFPPLLSRLVGLSKGPSFQEMASGQDKCSPDDAEKVSHWLNGIPEELADLPSLRMTDVDKVFAQGRELWSSDDLELLKEAIEKRRRGWYDLLCLGLQNKRIEDWWAKGFYELVWEKEAILCTETNVTVVMDVLVTALAARDDQWTRKLLKLFCLMFGRLPIPLQENVVLTALGETQQGGELSGRRAHLVKLMSKDQVVQELMPLLNKVTSGNVDRLVVSVLWLSLFRVDTVFDYLVQAAVDNKGQVMPVVKILQHCPRLCALPSPTPGSMKGLCRALNVVISSTQLSESKARNLTNFLTALTKRYSFPPDSSSDLQKFSVKHNTPESHPAHSPVLGTADLLFNILQTTLDGAFIGRQVNSGESLRVDTALNVVVSVLDSDLPGEDFLPLMPFCLSILVSDLYGLYFDPWVEGELDKVKFRTRQVALKCGAALSSAIHKHRDLFSNGQFDWLLRSCFQCGWIHLALAWPAFSDPWDAKIASAFDTLINRVFQYPEPTDMRGWTLLLQLSSINEKVCSHTMAAIERCHPVVDSQWLIDLIRQLFTQCLPVELVRVVQCIKALVQQSVPTDQSCAGTSVVETSHLLQVALLGLLRWELSDNSIVHVLANYQAALQTILPRETKDLNTVRQVMCHILETLTHFTEVTLTLILQVTALEVLGLLQRAVREEKERRKKINAQKNEENETTENERQNDRRENNEDSCVEEVKKISLKAGIQIYQNGEGKNREERQIDCKEKKVGNVCNDEELNNTNEKNGVQQKNERSEKNGVQQEDERSEIHRVSQNEEENKKESEDIIEDRIVSKSTPANENPDTSVIEGERSWLEIWKKEKMVMFDGLLAHVLCVHVTSVRTILQRKLSEIFLR